MYYVIYNPEFWRRDRHDPFEVYKLTEGAYCLQSTEPCWMPEVGLGLGRYQGEVGGLKQEILTWFDEEGNRYLSEAEQERLRTETAEVRVAKAQARANKEKARLKKLERLLKEKGIDIDNLLEE